jgi:hypothetical protein
MEPPEKKQVLDGSVPDQTAEESLWVDDDNSDWNDCHTAEEQKQAWDHWVPPPFEEVQKFMKPSGRKNLEFV